MSSMERKIQRRIKARYKSEKDAKSQLFRSHEDAIGYDVLHPTRGWKRVSARRVLAGAR